jgi:hypothetical protein
MFKKHHPAFPSRTFPIQEDVRKIKAYHLSIINNSVKTRGSEQVYYLKTYCLWHLSSLLFYAAGG